MACRGEYMLVTTTCPDKDAARKIAGLIIEARLAACVQLLPIDSIYTWKDNVCDESEILLLIKTKTTLYEQLQSLIWRNHAYDVPEIIQLPITGGLPAYMKWIDEVL
ncbi:MAG: divalent-cation tolerance protein CutA [Oscillospiraceae bacterium]|nr:divalent-cation tolerance protein CutA [Oscillospiraceae bacterium]